jgi:hypothetical protein
VYVLHGQVCLSTGDVSWEGSPRGSPHRAHRIRHTLDALEDSTVLLTVAKHH